MLPVLKKGLYLEAGSLLWTDWLLQGQVYSGERGGVSLSVTLAVFY